MENEVCKEALNAREVMLSNLSVTQPSHPFCFVALDLDEVGKIVEGSDQKVYTVFVLKGVNDVGCPFTGQRDVFDLSTGLTRRMVLHPVRYFESQDRNPLVSVCDVWLYADLIWMAPVDFFKTGACI